jgi:hypothetical protein
MWIQIITPGTSLVPRKVPSLNNFFFFHFQQFGFISWSLEFKIYIKNKLKLAPVAPPWYRGGCFQLIFKSFFINLDSSDLVLNSKSIMNQHHKMVNIKKTIYVRVMNSPRWIARMIYCACIEACILGLKEVYSLCYFLQSSSWHESWIIKIWISKESINFKNMKWFSGFCITKDSHTSINLFQIHCRYWQGYKQAKTQLIVKWARGPTCWILTHIHEKNNFKMNLNPTAGTGKDIMKPNLIHSLTSEQGDQHARSSPKMMEKKYFKMNLNPIAGTGRNISKPNLTHSQLSKGSSMLDPHPHSWIFFFQSETQPHCRYR